MEVTNNIKINMILNVIKTISSIIFPLITFPYISRVLQPENIGKVNFASSFVSYFILIASLGISTYAIRECSIVRNDKNKLEEVSSQIFSINFCTTIISYLLMFIVLIFWRKLDSYRTIIIIQSMAIAFTTLGCEWINNAMEDFVFITIRTISFQIISLILMFIFVREADDYIIYALIALISSSGANIVNVFYRKKYCKIRFVKKMNLRKHLKPIGLLFVMILAQTIFNSSDITMIGLMRGDFEVGLYSTAVKISNLINQVVASLVWVIMPRVTIYFIENDYEKINRALKKILSVLFVIGLPCVVGTICLSKEIIFVVAGEEYLGASKSLCILMFSFAFSLIGGNFLGNMILLPSKREDIYMRICCISTLINIVLNLLLISKWGINAAALTTAIATFFMFVMLLLVKDKQIRLDYFWEVLKTPLIGSILIVVLCVIIKKYIEDMILRMIVCVSTSVFTYFLILFSLKNEICIEFLSGLQKKIKSINVKKNNL